MSTNSSHRKEEILDAALALAFEGGPNRVTTVAIADRLNLTQPAIYRHFASKAALWSAIKDRLGADVDANIARVEAKEASALCKLNSLVVGHLDLIRRTPALPEIMLARDPGCEDALVRIAMQERMATFQKTLIGLCAAAQAEGALRPDIGSRDLAALIMGVMQSLVLRLMLTRDPTPIVEDGARLLSLQIAAFARESEERCATS